jgi:hypothetical protein
MTVEVADSFRWYRAPYELPNVGAGTWYGEYSGIFPARLFVVADAGAVAVAPFDLPFGPDKEWRATVDGQPPAVNDRLPPVAGVEHISCADFERPWELRAQPRCHDLAQHAGRVLEIPRDGDVTMYVASPFPASFKAIDDTEGDSTLYFEYADGIGRRSFELWASGEVWVSGPGELSGAKLLEVARSGRHWNGEELGALRPFLITHGEFEALWERYVIPYLHVAAGLM